MANLVEAKDRFVEEAVAATQNFLLSRHQKLNWQDHLFVSRDTLHLVDDDEYEQLLSQLGQQGSRLSRCGQILMDIKSPQRVDYYGNQNKYQIDTEKETVRTIYRTILCADLIGGMMPFMAKVAVPKVPDHVFNVMIGKFTQDLPPATGMPVKTFRRFKEQLRPEDGLLVGMGCRLAWSLSERDLSRYSIRVGEGFDALVCLTLSSYLVGQFVHQSVPDQVADRLLAQERGFVKTVRKTLEKLSFSFNPAANEDNNPLVGYVEGYMLNRLLREVGRKNGKMTLEEYLNPPFHF